MIKFIFVGDLSCPELASTGFLFEQRSTGAAAQRADCLPHMKNIPPKNFQYVSGISLGRNEVC
jgi:hypothetical protein